MTDQFEVCNGVIAKGVARLFYQDGVPLPAIVGSTREAGLDISWLNVARELGQQGFGPDRIVEVLSEVNDWHTDTVDISAIAQFVQLDDEGQKECLWAFWSTLTTAEELLGV